MNTHEHIVATALPVKTIDLTRHFRDFWGKIKVKAVNGISFEIRRGEIFGLLGPNGSGKTTTIKMLLGLLRPDAGALSVFGLPPGHRAGLARIGYLPEENLLDPQLTPVETLDFFGKLFDIERDERRRRIDRLLELTGLQTARRRRIGEFSKGMARRIGLAQALINDPDLVLLDEPTAGLDPIGCRQIKDLLLDLKRRNKTVLLSSHLLADVEDVCSQIMIMHKGRVIIQGKVSDLLEDPTMCRLIFSAPDAAVLKKAIAELGTIIGHEPRVDRPMRTLEQFFIKKLEEAVHQEEQNKPGLPTPTEDGDNLESRLRHLTAEQQ